MYPSSFEYYRASNVDEALDLLTEHGGLEVELLAGGHSLVPAMKARLASPDVLIDIGKIDELIGIERDGEVTTIGALTNYADVADNHDLRETAPALTEAAHAIGDNQVRNMGTVGGNIAHADPASDLPGAVLASNATVYAQGRDGERAIDADDFFTGMYETVLKEDELLTQVVVPHLGSNDTGVYMKKPAPSSDAIVGIAAVLHTDGERIESARVTANGTFDHAQRLKPVENVLEDEPIDPTLATKAAAYATDDVQEFELMDDIHTSRDSRAQLLKVYTERALDTVLNRIG